MCCSIIEREILKRQHHWIDPYYCKVTHLAILLLLNLLVGRVFSWSAEWTGKSSFRRCRTYEKSVYLKELERNKHLHDKDDKMLSRVYQP